MIVRPLGADRATIVEYVAAKGGMTGGSLVGDLPFELLAVMRGHRFMGAVLFNNWRGTSIETHWAGEPGWLTRANLRAIFAYPFLQLGCRRVTGIMRESNVHARRVAERIGFKFEGACREGFEDGTTAMIYGLLKSDCRWIA